MIGNIRINYAGEAERHNICVGFNIHYSKGDRLNTPLLSMVNILTVFRIRKIVYGR